MATPPLSELGTVAGYHALTRTRFARWGERAAVAVLAAILFGLIIVVPAMIAFGADPTVTVPATLDAVVADPGVESGTVRSVTVEVAVDCDGTPHRRVVIAALTDPVAVFDAAGRRLPDPGAGLAAALCR